MAQKRGIRFSFAKLLTGRGNAITGLKDYQYGPLDADRKDFRLIHVAPAREYTDEIQVVLGHASLTSSPLPHYETVSYVWGDPKQRASLRLDAVQTTAPASSVAAIRRLRKPDRSRMLWIDAICIDQASRIERAQQVAIMSDIYTSSRGNLIYLGEGNKQTHWALADMRLVLKEMNEDTDALQNVTNTVLDRDAEGHYYADSGFRSNVDFTRLIAFFSLPWFRRLWVFQEAAMAPSNHCFLERFTFDLRDALRTARWLEHKNLHIPYDLFDCEGRNNAYQLWYWVDLEVGQTRGGLKVSCALRELFDISRDLEVSEPRDRIYGTFALSRELRNVPEALRPNYQKPINELFRDATRYVIQTQKSRRFVVWSDISLYSKHELDRKDYISWVPPWNSRYNAEKDPARFPLLFACGGEEDRDNEVMTSPKMIDPNIFEVPGFELDRITQVSPTLTDKVVSTARSMWEWVDSTWRMLKDKGESAAADILIAGTNADFQEATPQDLAAASGFRHFFAEEQRLPNLSKTAKERIAGRYYSALRQACLNRRVFRTATTYIGIGPQIMQKGDIVAVIFGSGHPFVLRPRGDYYQLLGPCYVHGIMKGQALERHRSEKQPSTVFRIR